MSAIKIFPTVITTEISNNAVAGGALDSSYPDDNLQDMNINSNIKANAASTNLVIDFDFGVGVTKAVDYLLILNHNYSDTGLGIKFYYDTNDNNSFPDPVYLLGAAGSYHDYTTANSPFWIETFTAPGTAKRYYQAVLEGKAAFQQEIALILTGVSITLGANYSLGGNRGDGYKTEQRETPGGQIWTNQLASERKRFSLTWDNIDETDKDYWDTIWGEIQGRLYPFLIMDTDENYYFVRSEQDELPLVDDEYQLYSFSLNLLEEKINNDLSA